MNFNIKIGAGLIAFAAICFTVSIINFIVAEDQLIFGFSLSGWSIIGLLLHSVTLYAGIYLLTEGIIEAIKGKGA